MLSLLSQLLAHVNSLNNNDLNTKIMTYSLGADAPTGIMKDIACNNEGIWYQIPDSTCVGKEGRVGCLFVRAEC